MTEIPVTCASLLAQISAYLDGELDASACAAVEQHASTCDRCAQVIGEFREATGLCRSAAEAPLPESVRELAQARVRALLARSRRT